MLLHRKTHTPFDKWFEQHQNGLESLFGSLVQTDLRALLFASFELGAKIGAGKDDDIPEG